MRPLPLFLPALLLSAPEPVLDLARLHRDFRALADPSMEGREVGTPGGKLARAFLQKRFREQGLEPVFANYQQPFAFGVLKKREGANLVGRIRGTAHPDRFIVLSAHFDHLGIRNGKLHPGADDNASGVAVLLALAAHFQAHRPRHSLLIAAFDGEEFDLQGSRAFVAHLPCRREQVALNVNLDMLGHDTRNELFVVGTLATPSLRRPMEQLALRAKVKLLLGHDSGRGTDDWTDSSDHFPFHQAGIPWLYFGVDYHPDYHRPTDTADRIQPDFLDRTAATVLDAVRTVDGMEF